MHFHGKDRFVIKSVTFVPKNVISVSEVLAATLKVG